MKLDELIIRELEVERSAAPSLSGSLDEVVRRGRRRRTASVAAIALLTVIFSGAVIGIGAWLVGSSDPDFVSSDIPESWTAYTDANGLLGDCGCDMAVSSDGTVWLIGPDGVSYFDGTAWSAVQAPNDFYRGGDLSVNAGPDGVLWFTGGGQAARYSSSEWTFIEPENIEAFGPLLQVVVSGDGAAWGREGDDVVKLAEGSFAPVNEQFEPLPSREWDEENPMMVSPAIAVGPDGTLWMAGGPGGGNGLYGYDGTTVQTHPAPGVIAPELLAVAPDGSAWLAADFFDMSDPSDPDSRLLRFDGTTWTTFPLGGVVDAAFDADGTGWFIIDEVSGEDLLWRSQYAEPGAYRFDGEGWTHFTIEDGLAGLDLTAVEIGDDGSVWFGTHHHGVTRYQPGTNPESGKSISIDGEELSQEDWPAHFSTTTAPTVPEE